MASLQVPIPAPRNSFRKYLLTALIALLGTAALWPVLGRDTSAFLPHWYCFLGDRPLIYTHLVSDLIIGLSYVAISVTLAWIVHRAHRGIPFHWLFLAFGTFIIACGGTHFMEVVTLFKPVYWLSAYVKGVTAAASLATAIALPLVTPKILAQVDAVALSEERRVRFENANRELVRASQELHELDQLKTSLVAQRAVDLGTWEWQPMQDRILWSDAVERIHGLSYKSFGGDFQAWMNTVHPEDRDRVRSALENAWRSGLFDIEYRALHPDGGSHWTAARGKVSFDAHGRPARMLGICMDIDARKKASLELEQQARVLDLANDAIFVLDPGGRITFWNRGAEQLYGWTKEEATGRNAHDLLRTEFPVPFGLIEAALAGQGHWQGELKHTTRSGAQVIVASRWSVHVDELGRRLGTFEINRDISAQKLAEEALRRSEKLAAAGRLAATIAHEINNPLEAVTNLIYLVGNNCALDPASREYLAMADRELQRVAHLTRQTLGFYREGSQRERLHPAEMMDEAVSIYSGRLQAKAIEVEKRYAPRDHMGTVPGEIRQVFANLIANAIDALPQSGKLVLRIAPGAQDGATGVRVTVADNGIGIPPENRTSIFEPFFTTKKDVGTGLGLWVAQEIVTKHGGKIRVRSRVGPGLSGTVFTIYLPQSAAEDHTTAQCA